MVRLLHELWLNADGGQTLCLAGPMGDGARAMMSKDAKLAWTVTAGSHFEAMTKYYEYMNWGSYSTEQEWDRKPYPDDWLVVQRSQ